jgi:hypothetical protein
MVHTFDKYKARLIVKHFRQRENIDFLNTFSPITRITSSIRVLISITGDDVSCTILNNEILWNVHFFIISFFYTSLSLNIRFICINVFFTNTPI